MFTKKDKLHKQGIKKMDALVTGLLLGGVVASIYGIKKATEHKTMEHKTMEEGQTIDPRQEESKRRAKKILKMLIFGCEHEEKKGFFQKLFKK